MIILLDINHPADFHFFKNVYHHFDRNNHKVVISASSKDISIQLLENSNIPYIYVGDYGASIWLKMLLVPIMAFRILKLINEYKPDYLMGFNSSRITHAAFIKRMNPFIFTDTEFSGLQLFLILPFIKKIYTNSSFKKDFGKIHHRINSFKELAYLHPNNFEPDISVLDELGLKFDDTFFILRFVSWEATHDIGNKGLNIEEKLKLIRILNNYGKVFISSEMPLENIFEEYRIKIDPTKIHCLMYYSTLFYGESATMAAESAIMGVNSFYISHHKLGYIAELESKYQLISHFKNTRDGIETSFTKLKEILDNPENKALAKKKRQEIINDKIDLTEFLINLIEKEHHPNLQSPLLIKEGVRGRWS